MNYQKKIIHLNQLNNYQLHREKDKIILCYGHFNVLHPGHLRYLDYARKFGNKLYVVIQGHEQISTSNNEHYFSDIERAEGLAAIIHVNKILIETDFSIVDVIKKINPSHLVLGKEHENSKSKVLKKAIKLMHDRKGLVVFHAGEAIYYPTNINYKFEKNSNQRNLDLFKAACKRQKIFSKKILSICKNFHRSNLLIIGDTIVDQYVACDALGMSAEAPVIVARELYNTEYLGGAGIVASHIKAIGAKCTYISVVGNDQAGKFTEKTLKKLNIKNILIRDISRPTTYKIRYMIEKQKMFRVSRLKEHDISKEIEDQVIDNIKSISSDINGIIVSDFVYGVITPRILETINLISKQKQLPVFGDLQCSSQIGNILKFKNFNTLFPTEREARTSLNNKDDGIERIANKILTHTNSRNLILKLGAEGFVAYHEQPDGFVLREHFTALTSNPIDVTGAGDSLLAGIATSLCMGGSFMEASVIGSCMAALAVEKIGNAPITNLQLTDKLKEIFQND